MKTPTPEHDGYRLRRLAEELVKLDDVELLEAYDDLLATFERLRDRLYEFKRRKVA